MIAFALCYMAIGFVQGVASFLEWSGETEAKELVEDIQALLLTIIVATAAYLLIWPYCMAYDYRSAMSKGR